MLDKKKLLIINGAQFGYSTGHYYYCKYLKDQFEINYICFDRGMSKLELEAVNVIYVPFGKNRIIRIYKFLKTCIEFSSIFSPDILFVVYFKACFLLSLFIKSETKLLDIRTGSLHSEKIIRKLDNTLLRYQSLLFDRILILSESLKDHLKINNSHTLVLPLGADVLFKGQHSFDTIKLIYVGTLDRRRVYDTIEGVRFFLENNCSKKDKFFYTIIGFGSDKEEKKILKSIQENQLESYISYVGVKTQDEIAVYFETHNIGVAYVPVTEYYQRQPVTKIAEYALSGLVTIGTDTYENKLLITTVNGVLCKDNSTSFSEAIATISKNSTSFNSNHIRASFKKYEWEILIKEKLSEFLS